MHTTDQLVPALEGRYTIERLIGEGGMATVYLARDVRHNRKVALKVLRPDLGAVVGVDRFLAEIEVTANLQHPNLLPLFDSGAAGELLFYVMPFVAGESLRSRLDREKQLPVDEAIRLATAIGSALDYAHRQGVIHRDLKPENVLLQEGQPLVADFGIALAVSNAGGTRITQTGLSLGTPHYMSPEQATSDRVIDGRTDIYSLGALTYEMLTGEPPHTGSTSQAIIARVLTERPRPIRTSRPSVPEQVEGAVERALEKLPADRWTSAREFTEALTGARPVTRASTVATAVPGTAPLRPRVSGREGLAWGVALIALATTAWLATRRGPAPLPMARLDLALPDSIAPNGSLYAALPSVSITRDGRLIAFIAARRTGELLGQVDRQRIFVRSMDTRDATELAGTESSSMPVFSPDGRWLAYLDVNRAIRKVPVEGGTSQRLADSAGTLAWADDGNIYAAYGPAIFAVDPNGGGTRRVARDTTAGSSVSQIEVLPGSRHAMLRVLRQSEAAFTAIVDLRTGEFRDARLDALWPRYVPPGFLVYQSEGGMLSAARFDLAEARITGTPVRLAEDVMGLANTGLDFAVSENGTIVYRWTRAGRAQPTRLVRLDRRGTERVLRADGQRYDQPRLSPDGQRLVVRVGAGTFNSGDLWVLELASGAFTRLTTGNNSFRPSWSRDGSRVFYMTGRAGTSAVKSKPWDGSGTETTFLDRPTMAEFVEGTRGAWSVIRTYAARDILIVPTDSIPSATPVPFVTGPANETDVAISPDGKLMAYQSDESGRFEIFVRAIPGPGPRVPVSVGGGTAPVWSRDGATLYYRLGRSFFGARVAATPSLAVTRRDSLFSADVEGDGVGIAVTPDGQGFYAAIGSARQPSSSNRLSVLTNWQSLVVK